MLENDEKISDDELFDVVGSAKILRVELDAFRLFAKNTIYEKSNDRSNRITITI